MTESVVVRLLVFGIAGVIGKELFGRADNRKMNPSLGKASVQSVGDERVGDVFAIPRQEEVHPVDSGCGDVEGVTTGHTGQNPAGNQTSGESLDWLVEVEERNVGEELKAFRCLGGLTIRGLVEHELRREQVELLPLVVPPLAGEFLPREL